MAEAVTAGRKNRAKGVKKAETRYPETMVAGRDKKLSAIGNTVKTGKGEEGGRGGRRMEREKPRTGTDG